MKNRQATSMRRKSAWRLGLAGWLFLLLGTTVGLVCYLLTHHSGLEPGSWWQQLLLPSDANNRATYYTFSILFGVMGLTCLAGAWQRLHTLRGEP